MEGIFSPVHLVVVLVIVLVIFGPKRLPGLGRSLGSGIREFKSGIDGLHEHLDDSGETGTPQQTGTQPTAVQQTATQNPLPEPQPQTLVVAGEVVHEDTAPVSQTATPQVAAALAAPSGEDAVARLTQLKSMLDQGVLTQAEFDVQKTKILAST